MPRRWLAGPWFVAFLVALVGIVIYAARPGSADGPAAPLSKARTTPKVVLSQAPQWPPRDLAEQLAAIRWYRNEIHNTAVEVCIRQADLCPKILDVLKGALKNFPIPPLQCRYSCPPGECGPDCTRLRRSASFSDPIPLDLRVTVTGWYANAIENIAVEHDSSVESFVEIEKVLKSTLASLRQARSTIR